MNDELKPCPHCGSDYEVEEWRHTDWTDWRVMCGRCGASTDWYSSRDAAIAAWNASADEFGADDDYERRMDELLCRLTNGKWSKSRSYSVDFMVSCVDEAYDEILDPSVESHYAPRNARADDAPISEKPAPSLKESTEDTQVLSDSREKLEADAVFDRVVGHCMARGDSLGEAMLHADGYLQSKQESDTREQLEADILEHYKTPEEKLKTVREWLDRQAAITKREEILSYEYKAERQSDRIFELHNERADALERVAELTAERDEFADELKLDAIALDELRKQVDELTAEVEAQRKRANDAERGVLDAKWYVSRDRYEDDIAELRHANSLLQSTIAELGVKVDEKQAELLEARASGKADPVEIQLALARFAEEWTTTDTRVQEQRCIVYHAQQIAQMVDNPGGGQ